MRGPLNPPAAFRRANFATQVLVLCLGLACSVALAETTGTAKQSLAAAQALLGDKTVETASIDTLKAVRAALDKLIEDFSDSDIAVQVLLEDTVGGLDVAGLDRRLAGGTDAATAAPATAVPATPPAPAADATATATPPAPAPDPAPAPAPAADSATAAAPAEQPADAQAKPATDDPVTARLASAEAAIAKAAPLSGQDKLDRLLAGQSALDTIVADFPASDTSVSLALGEKVGSIDPVALQAEIATLKQTLGGTATPVAPETQAAPAVPDATATDPLLVIVGTCLSAPNLPARPQGAGPISVRVVTGADGSIQGMPELVDPAQPDDLQRQVYSRTMLGLASCRDFAAAQHDSILQIDLPVDGTIGGTVQQAERAQTAAQDVVSPTEPTPPVQDNATADTQWQTATAASESALHLDRAAIADAQARLDALGFDPNGVDGNPGSGYRKALRAWQGQTGIPTTGYLDAMQLDSLKSQSGDALTQWLQNSGNADALAKASAPPITLTRQNVDGRWHLTATCGPKSKLPGLNATAVLNIQFDGRRTVDGTIHNSQGLNGRLRGQLSGRDFSGIINWGLLFGKVQFSVRIAEQSLTFGGRDSNGCRLRGRKD